MKNKTQNKSRTKRKKNRKFNFTKKNKKKFAGQKYELTAPNCKHKNEDCVPNKWQYAFNKNGTAYDLNIVKDGQTFTVVPNIEILRSNKDTNLYFSPMIYPKNKNLIERYVQTGMKFNKDYTKVNVGYNIGGPFFQFALDNKFGKNFYKGYSKDKQEIMNKNFKNGELLVAPASYPTILKKI